MRGWDAGQCGRVDDSLQASVVPLWAVEVRLPCRGLAGPGDPGKGGESGSASEKASSFRRRLRGTRHRGPQLMGTEVIELEGWARRLKTAQDMALRARLTLV